MKLRIRYMSNLHISRAVSKDCSVTQITSLFIPIMDFIKNGGSFLTISVDGFDKNQSNLSHDVCLCLFVYNIRCSVVFARAN